MAKASEAQLKANKVYREKNREKVRERNYFRTARMFIKSCENIDDLKELKSLLDNKLKELG